MANSNIGQYLYRPVDKKHNCNDYIYYEIVHEAHKKENKIIDLTITQDCK